MKRVGENEDLSGMKGGKSPALQMPVSDPVMLSGQEVSDLSQKPKVGLEWLC